MGRMRAPTAEQAAVIRLEGGPARVLAGAGSGKTHTMTELVSYRVDEHLRKMGGTAPERILALTFTVKAADEMRSRLLGRIGEQALKLTVSNFHSYALEIVDGWPGELGVEVASPRDPDRRGGHLTIRRPGFRAVVDALWERGVIPDYREPDGIRIGPAPLSTSFAEVRDGLAVLRGLLP